MAQELVWELIKNTLEIFGISREFVRVAVFFGFYALTSIVLYLAHDKNARRFYLGILLVAIITPMLISMTVWPFYQWSPLHSSGELNDTTYTIYLVDNEGDEIRLDRRAVPFITDSLHRNYARKMLREYNRTENKKLSKYILSNSCRYRDNVDEIDLIGLLSFPKGQIDYKWKEEELKNISDFVGLRVYEREVVLSKNARIVSDSRTKSLELWHNRTPC